MRSLKITQEKCSCSAHK